MSEERARRYGECQVCGRQTQLRKDGTIWHHAGMATNWDGRREYRCAGGGCLPEGSSDD